MSLPTRQVKQEMIEVVTVINDEVPKVQQAPMTFLSLAPTTSAGYRAAPTAPRRTSSLSSEESTTGLRFLKLVPDENRGDSNEVAVE
jgi:hypothetical protein